MKTATQIRAESEYIDAICGAVEDIAVATGNRDLAIRKAARAGVSIDDIAVAAGISRAEAEAVRDALGEIKPPNFAAD